MEKAKKFFYVSAGVMMLALSFHFGQSISHAQVGGQIIAASVESTGVLVIVTSNGDAFVVRSTTGAWYNGVVNPAESRSLGNVWSGQVTQGQVESWGQVKARYR